MDAKELKMQQDLTFFDVETPNRFNSKICSIGVVRTNSKGCTEYENHFYVNPEQGFDDMNISIHGIKPSMVIEAPTFAELWESELFDVFDDSTLVAHNAFFDLNVLGKTLGAYGFEKPAYPYICTMESAMQALPALQDYQLSTLSQRYGVPLPRHHDAFCDAKACEGVFWGLLDECGEKVLAERTFIPKGDFVSTYTASNRPQLMTDLYGIIVGISLDGVISHKELCALEEWKEKCSSLSDDEIIKNANDKITELLAKDGVDAQDFSAILNLARPFVFDDHNKPETVMYQQLLGIIKGISADATIGESEVRGLRNWVSKCNSFFSDRDFLAIEEQLNVVLADGIVSPEEEDRLLALFDKMVNPIDHTSKAISYSGKKFVLSGNFTYGDKHDVEAVIKERGGEIAKGVSGKVSYVVVGNEGSARYANGEYGSKVKRAMELQESGKPIQIIMESDLDL